MKALTLKQTAAKILSIKGRSKTLVQDIHLVAFNSLTHAEVHGDYTFMTKLYAAVSNGHKTGLVTYFTAFGPVKFRKKDRTFRKDNSKEANAFDLVKAAEVSPDAIDRKRHQEETEFDGVKFYAQLIELIERRAVKAAEAGDTETANKIAAMIPASETVQ